MQYENIMHHGPESNVISGICVYCTCVRIDNKADLLSCFHTDSHYITLLVSLQLYEAQIYANNQKHNVESTNRRAHVTRN